MLRPLDFDAYGNFDLVPQAIFKKPFSYFRDKLGIMFVNSYDDLDDFQGALLTFNGDWAFALKHYRGHPDDSTTVYLSRDYQNAETISSMVSEIARELDLPRDAISWQRGDKHDL
jgi:hypothetical protein